jgi:hypothetical protein
MNATLHPCVLHPSTVAWFARHSLRVASLRVALLRGMDAVARVEGTGWR